MAFLAVRGWLCRISRARPFGLVDQTSGISAPVVHGSSTTGAQLLDGITEGLLGAPLDEATEDFLAVFAACNAACFDGRLRNRSIFVG